MQKSNITEYIRNELFRMQDTKYKEFQAKLVPTVSIERIIGVRIPVLRTLAKSILARNDVDIFLNDLPHQYYEQNQLHAVVLSSLKDFKRCVREVDKFLPYIDNWATCDTVSPNCFKKRPEQLLEYIDRWIESKHEYSVRFGVKILMQFYLDETFCTEHLAKVANIKREEYYIQTAQAWYFATALAKHYTDVLPILQNHSLERQIHNKTIQKAVESFRISEERKNYLKTLRRK